MGELGMWALIGGLAIITFGIMAGIPWDGLFRGKDVDDGD